MDLSQFGIDMKELDEAAEDIAASSPDMDPCVIFKLGAAYGAAAALAAVSEEGESDKEFLQAQAHFSPSRVS